MVVNILDYINSRGVVKESSVEKEISNQTWWIGFWNFGKIIINELFSIIISGTSPIDSIYSLLIEFLEDQLYIRIKLIKSSTFQIPSNFGVRLGTSCFKQSPFFDESYISWVERHHIIKAASLCKYDEKYLNNLKNASDEEKEMFGWHMGFKRSEIDRIIAKFC